jgi:hypothetical protein
VNSFEATVGVSNCRGEQARVVRRFALVYAAGALACRYGILPADRKTVRRAVKRCFKRVIWPESLVASHKPEQSLELVQKYIQRNRKKFIHVRRSKVTITREVIETAPGLIIKQKNKTPEFLFSQKVFRRSICDGWDSDVVWQHLHEADLLITQGGGKRTVTRDFPKPARRMRVISIRAAIVAEKPATAN